MIYIENMSTGKYMDIDNSVNEEIILKVIRAADSLLDDSDYEIYVELTDNDRIQAINSEFREIDKPTDVLSFPQFDFVDGEGIAEDEGIDPETGRYMLGDIIISLDKAYAQAEEYGHEASREIAFLAIHAFLHLLGFDHDTEKREKLMFDNANIILEKAGYKKHV